jgi:fructose-bisphosphate aldolase class II
MLVNINDMLTHAYQNRYGIGAFDLISLDFLKAILDGATHCQAPVILSLTEPHFDYYDFEMIMPAVLAAAQRTSIPVAIHLDHGASLQSAITAIGLGCNSIMVDAAGLSFAENLSQTREVVNMAHSCGVPVEGELGYVANALKHPQTTVYTSPEEAQRYVAETGVDYLAIAIDTPDPMLGEPQLDFETLAKINEVLKMPLVIHGGTDLSEGQFRQLIANGVTKINYYTALATTVVNTIRHNVHEQPETGYSGMVQNVQDAIRLEVEHRIQLWGSAGRAKEVLAYCQPWQHIEHLIIYNTNSNLSEPEVLDIMQQGRQVLSTIPGVLKVFTGQAVKEDAQYRYCWLIRFANSAVIDSYREHPVHKNFADTLFRPHAKERISIDYLETGNE